MKNLLRVFLIVLALVLLSVLKHLLDKYSRESIIFHYNLLSCIQYFILIALFAWLIFHGIYVKLVRKKPRVLAFWIMLLSLFAFSEAFIFYLLKNSSKIPQAWDRFLTEYYLTYEINFPQLSYDPELTYTLKKNSAYEHENLEFSNMIHANHAGLRDDTAALRSPQLICLGDSYTMGWGVDQQSSYPKKLQQLSGLKVLNAGVSSYGTARELLLLNRLDTSQLKYLVIQYCYNDWAENEAFLKAGRYQPAGSQQTLDRTFRSYQLARKYFPFKYSLTLLRMFVRSKFFKPVKQKEPMAWVYSLDYVKPAAEAFIKILSGSNLDFRKLRILLIDTNRYPVFEHHFLDAVEDYLKKGSFAADFKESIRIVKFPELNDQEYFYPLDNHLKENGHALIAQKLLEALRSGE